MHLFPVEDSLLRDVDFSFGLTQQKKKVLDGIGILHDSELFEFDEGVTNQLFLLQQLLQLVELGFFGFVCLQIFVVNTLNFFHCYFIELQLFIVVILDSSDCLRQVVQIPHLSFDVSIKKFLLLPLPNLFEVVRQVHNKVDVFGCEISILP